MGLQKFWKRKKQRSYRKFIIKNKSVLKLNLQNRTIEIYGKKTKKNNY